ncbi:hypothetical protein P4S95_25020 [Aneurinibacillus aneurinilyticus]|uniref:hypothetical protein n=1 Tax=Aneurinibacillus aneurinilyticus TaxID=1391 RepID=UPI002E206DF4|nr:hypothetical protein [Aneurinibacillus aneurinilyticus]
MSQVLFILLMFMESISRLLVMHKVEERRCTLHTEKHAVRVTLFYSSMDTKGVDCSERKRPPQRDTNKAFRLPSRAIATARRKRTAIVSPFASTQMFCSPAWLG